MKKEEYFELFEKAKEINEKKEKSDELLLKEEFKEEIEKITQIKNVLESLDIDNRNWEEEKIKDEKELKGLIGFLSGILKLKSSEYLTIEFKRDNQSEKKRIFISKKGFYGDGYGVNKSKLSKDYLFRDYINKSVELREKIKGQAKTEEDKKKIDEIFEYIKTSGSKRERDNLDIYDKDVREENINFEFYEKLCEDKTKAKLTSFEITQSNLRVCFEYDNNGDVRGDSEGFSYGGENWNLSLLFSLRERILNYVDEISKKLLDTGEIYLKTRERFYEIINPYILADTL